MTLITAKVTTKVTWHGQRVITKLQNNANDAAKAAGTFYFNLVTREFKRAPWGSKRAQTGNSLSNVPILANSRIRFKHSSPGETPYRQTENLANSIRITSSKRLAGEPSKAVTRISTRVPYSRTLERGLPQISQPQSLKRFTKIRLKNPLKLRPGTIIAPRPVWLPVFQKTNVRMLAIIKREMAK